jgi:mRNA interferase MazF
VVNRGEVWWAEHPIDGRRPVCVLTRSAAIPVLNAVLVAPATRTIRGIPTEVFLDRDDGMVEECALTLDNVSPIPKTSLSELITALSPPKMDELCRSLSVAVDCA